MGTPIPDLRVRTPTQETRAARTPSVLPWVVTGVGLLVVVIAEWWLAQLSIAPFFGEYPTRTESGAVALAMISMVLLEAAVAVLAWRAGLRRLVLLYVLPAVAALVQAFALILNRQPDDEQTRPPWDVVRMISVTNLVIMVGVIVVTALASRWRTTSGRHRAGV